jgi:hypothetical protein
VGPFLRTVSDTSIMLLVDRALLVLCRLISCFWPLPTYKLCLLLNAIRIPRDEETLIKLQQPEFHMASIYLQARTECRGQPGS